MKYSKRISSIITSVAIMLQILLSNYILINAQTNNIKSLQTQEESLKSNITINGLFTKGIQTPINELYRSKITLFGCECKQCDENFEPRHKFEISFDTSNKKLIIDDLAGSYDNHPFNPSFDDKKYLSVKLIDKNGTIKKELSMTGNDNVKKSLELNNVNFEYGDSLRIYHAEAGNHTKINGNVYDINGQKLDLTEGTSNDILTTYDFEITTLGLKLVEPSTNELSKTKITLLGLGDCPESPSQGPYHKFELTLDPLTKKLKVDNLVGLYGYGNHDFHPYFKDEYINVTLFDKYGNIKKELSLKGTDNVIKAKDVLNDVDFEYGDHLRILHAEADWRTKITGNVYDINGQKLDLSERTSNDILTKYDFEITKSGLQLVHTFTTGLDRSKITLAGVGCQEGIHRFELLLNPETKQLNVKILNGLGDGQTHPFHPYFKDEYINIKLLDKDGNVKKEVSIKGTDNVKIIADALNDFDFKYGDRLRFFHDEAEWRTKIDGNVYNTSGQTLNNLSNGTSKLILNSYDFEITTSGLREIPQFTNELNKTKIILSGVGCEESPGEGGYHKFELSLNPLTKQLKVDNLVGLYANHPFHPYFGDNEYINITLFDKYGNVKKEFLLYGNENVQRAKNTLNNINFDYGDYLSIYHREADWRTKVEGNVYNTSGTLEDLSGRTSKDTLNSYNFEITKLGLKEVYKNKYSPFITSYK